MQDRIVVDYAAMQGAQSEMTKIAGQMTQELDDLMGNLNKIVWDGADRDAYMAHQEQATKAIADIQQLLIEIAGAVGQAHENYAETERSNAASW